MGNKIIWANPVKQKYLILRMVLKIKKNLPVIIGTVIGAIGGFIYYKTIGCTTGHCPITSNPWLSIIWGGLMGNLLIGMFKNKK